MVTTAPLTLAPVGSTTVPLMLPEISCARATTDPAINSTTHKAPRTQRLDSVIIVS
jgi:hypothetical protein